MLQLLCGTKKTNGDDMEGQGKINIVLPRGIKILNSLWKFTIIMNSKIILSFLNLPWQKEKKNLDKWGLKK